MTTADVTQLAGVAGAGRTREAMPARAARGADAVEAGRFGALLGDRLRAAPAGGTGGLRWSGHAVDRLAQHRIAVSEGMHQRLAGAVDDLAGKGARQSVVLVDDLAFVVSVSNRTVITAVGADRMKDQIFTNIDSVAVR